MSSIVEGLIDQYITGFYRKHEEANELKSILKASEPSFDDWDNDEDEVYNDL